MKSLPRLAPASAIVLAALAVSTASLAATRTIYKFTLPPGGSKTISLPLAQAPISLAASVTFSNGGTLTPSGVVGAIVNEDPSSGQLTWVGTNADGTQAGGNTLAGSQVAAFGDTDAVVTATPANGGLGTLTFTQSASQTAIAGTYYVRLSY